MICCLNPDCHNPPHPDGTQFCLSCATPLVLLRRYRPTKRLGGGGFGKTYLAEDIEKFNELCVIKQFAPQVQGTAVLQMATRLFEQEARRLQQLGEHPQIPALLAYFEQDRRLYLVQQYIEGQNLLQELKQHGNLSDQKIREFLLELLEILKSVHQQNVIHRDIKPENIIRRVVTPSLSPTTAGESSRGSQLVLIDFGASKQLTATVMSNPGTFIGSFGYVPIEQMEGGEAYPASDLYSLGATCFHLLTGVNPWELWKKQAYGWVETWREHLMQPVSKRLGRILDKLLQADYQQRYQSAEAVLEDLTRQLQPRVSPAGVSPRQPSPLPSPENPTVPLLPQSSPLPSPENPTLPLFPKASPLPPPVSYTVPLPLESLPSHGLASAKQNAKFKKPLLVVGAILVLGFGGYGVWQMTTVLPTNDTYEKLAIAKTLRGHTDVVNSVAISQDGQTLVSGGRDNAIKIWNLKTEKLKTTLSGGLNDSFFSLALSPDGQTLASGTWDNSVKIWNLKTGELKTTLTGYTSWVRAVAISPDGQTLVTGSGDNNIKIWNLQTGELKTTLTEQTEEVNCLAISQDGQTLVSGSGNEFYLTGDNSIRIWNLKTGELKATLTGHASPVKSVAVSPDAQTLVSGSEDKTIKIWNLKTRKLVKTLTGHSDSVNSVAISPDGQILVSGSGDNTIKVWNLKTGELVNTLTGHSDSVNSVAISPDGKTLVSGGNDNTVKIWQVPK